MVTSGNLEEVIELVKKVMVYGEDKGGSSQTKTENKQKKTEWRNGGKGVRANGALVVDQRERSKLFQETPNRKSLPVL